MALDVGCGANPRFTMERSLVVGIDIDRNSLLELKRRKWPGIPVVADAAHLPFRDNSFEKVNCSHILEHVQDENQTMKEISRVTKAGGQLELKVPFMNKIFPYETQVIAKKL